MRAKEKSELEKRIDEHLNDVVKGSSEKQKKEAEAKAKAQAEYRAKAEAMFPKRDIKAQVAEMKRQHAEKKAAREAAKEDELVSNGESAADRLKITRANQSAQGRTGV